MWHKSLSATILVLMSFTAFAEKECKLEKYAELPVTMQGTRPLVKGTINGEPVLFMTDSGAGFSMLRRESAARLGLRLGALPRNLTIRGVNGEVDARLASVQDFTLAGFAGDRVFHRVEFIVGGSVAGAGADGIIGQNILGHADTEFDLANGVIRLLMADGCKKRNLAYWSGAAPVGVASMDALPGNHHIISTALLNGKKIRIALDSGASTSVLTLDAAKRIGITPEDDNVVAAGLGGGLGKRRTEVWVTHFDTFDFGGEQIKNARLRIADITIGHADMLLGADFLLSHRVLVSNSQQKLYFTYNGGPVFDLGSANDRPKVAKAESQDDAAEATSVDSQAGVQDTSEIKRRAMASAGRRAFVDAIADFDAAIKLDPNDADSYLQRGLAYVGNRQPQLAMNDFDRALAIKPDLTKALLTRGRLRLTRRDDTGAREDFDAAVRANADDSGIRLDIARAYLSAGRFDDAIVHFDAWIPANQKSDQLPFALTQRCRARAMANKELEIALTDCKAALRKVTRDSGMLDNRALVYLRMGDYDKAIKDFNSSIKIQPKGALAWYGLGLAQKAKGLQADGQKSIQTALEINPRVDTSYKRVGLNP